jgi:WD40 repeat protein
VSFPPRCASLAEVDGWRLAAVLGDWRGKAFHHDVAWVAADGLRAVVAKAWGGDAWGDAEVAWVCMDLNTGDAVAQGSVAVSQATVAALWFSDEGDLLFGMDQRGRGFRVHLARGVAGRSWERAPMRDLDAWRADLGARFGVDLSWLGADANARWALAVGTQPGEVDALVRVDLATGARRWWHAGHTAAVTSLALSDDGRFLASVAEGDHARVWDLADGTNAWTFEPPLGTVAPALRFEGDGRALCLWDVSSASRPGRILRWDLRDGAEREAITLRGDTDEGLGALSPDGHRHAAVVPSGREVVLRDVSTPGGVGRRQRLPFAMRATALCFLDGGRALRVLGLNGASWCVGDLDVDASLQGPDAVPLRPMRITAAAQEFGAVYLLPDGARAVVPATDALRWLDLERGARGAKIPYDHGAPESASASSRRGELLCLAREHTVQLWRDDGRIALHLDLRALDDMVTAVALSPEGDTLAVGTALGVALVWRRG